MVFHAKSNQYNKTHHVNHKQITIDELVIRINNQLKDLEILDKALDKDLGVSN